MKGFFWLVFVSIVCLENVSGKEDQMIAAATRAIASPKIPGGSVRVVKDGKVVFDQGFGVVSNRPGARKWRNDEVVRIASMSKPITATLVAVLVTEGKLAFGDPVSKYIPAFDTIKMKDGSAAKRSPTIAECLSHTSGFKGGTIKDLPKDSAPHTGGSKEVVNEMIAQGLATEPGTKFAYTFRGYAVVARVIEVITGEKFSAVLTTKLLKPLGMTETGFVPSEDLIKRMPIHAGRDADPSRIASYIDNMSRRWENSAGGLLSSADDLVKFYQLHLDKGKVGEQQLISQEVLAQLYQPQPSAGKYGLGFYIDGSTIRHGGATGTLGWANRKKKLIYIGLTQAGSKNAKPFLNATSKVVSQ